MMARRPLDGLLLLVLLAMMAGGCTAAPPASPELLAQCTSLYGTWARYEQHPTFHHTGQQARAELALDDCRHGRYDEGIAELKRLLQRGRFVIAD